MLEEDVGCSLNTGVVDCEIFHWVHREGGQRSAASEPGALVGPSRRCDGLRLCLRSHARPALTASRSVLPGLNAGAVDAAMAMASPVRGLRPWRAGRIFVVNVPKPAMETSSLLARLPPTAAKTAATIRSAEVLSRVTRHEYQYKTSGEYLDDWKQIADSAPGEANEASFTVTGLTGGTAYTFELRAVSADGNSTAAEDGPVTPSAILTPPTIDDVAVTSTPLLTSSVGSTPDTYGRGETIEVSVR